MNPKTCVHCLKDEYIIKVAKYWHRITPGLVKTLVKVYKRVCEKNQNLVFMNELDLNHSEYGNFQKLRFHALIAKYRKEGRVIHRAWVITHRGAQFLRGEKSIPDKVRTILNKVIEHSDMLVNLTEVMKNEINFETYEDFASQIPMVEFAKEEDDIDSLKTVKTKKKKGKRYCLKCNGQLKIIHRIIDNPHPNTIKILSVWFCPDCGYEEIK